MKDDLTSSIEEIQHKLDSMRAYKEPMDNASWGYEEGVLITGNQALRLVKIIGAMKKALEIAGLSNVANQIENAKIEDL